MNPNIRIYGSVVDKMKIKKHITVVLLLVLSLAKGQQQTLYTNYLMNQYIYNPAYAGVEDGTQFNLGYRNQWLGFDGGPKSYILSGYGKLKKKPNMAVGGILMTEKLGLLQRTSFYGTYSYHLKINKKAAINFGLGVGGIQHKVRVYDARPYDKDDNFLGSDVLRALAFDANAGFYFYTKNFFLGFSDQQMPSSKIHWDKSIGKNTNTFYSYAGYNFHVNKEWVIQPSVLVRSSSPAPYQFEGNAKVIYDEMFWIGLSYRQKSSSSIMFGCLLKKQFTFAYAYDFTTTSLNKYSSGTHEIVLSYLIPFKKKKTKSELEKDADEEELNKIDNSLKTNLKAKKKKENEKEAEKPSDAEPSKTDGVQPEVKPAEPGTENKTEAQSETRQPEPGSTTETPADKPVETIVPAADKPVEQDAPKTEVQPDTKPTESEPKKETGTEPKN